MTARRSSISQRIGRLATEALISEASLFPKPGLVTPVSSGAHRDMDFRLFVASAEALRPCFEACADVGGTAAGSAPRSVLDRLRRIGREGEDSMFRATGGINTHKGAIFSLGLLSAAVAHVQSRGEDRLGDAACAAVAALCSGIVDRELSRMSDSRPLTAGERIYREHGVRGARGQAEDGYPLLRAKILPLLRRAYPQGRERFQLAALDALLLSMTELEDSCLLARGGIPGLLTAQRGAAEVLRQGGAGSVPGRAALIELDAVLVKAGLSPGGSADMVAAGLFLVTAEHCITMESRHIA